MKAGGASGGRWPHPKQTCGFAGWLGWWSGIVDGLWQHPLGRSRLRSERSDDRPPDGYLNREAGSMVVFGNTLPDATMPLQGGLMAASSSNFKPCQSRCHRNNPFALPYGCARGCAEARQSRHNDGRIPNKRVDLQGGWGGGRG